MRKSIFIGVLALLGLSAKAQKSDMNAIKETITSFAKAADENNTEQLAYYLDENYQITMNRLFGSNKVSIMPRAMYLEKIKTKEFGGDTRTLDFKNVIINGHTAVAHVLLKGKKMTFSSLFTLVKDESGNWKLISDVPQIQ